MAVPDEQVRRQATGESSPAVLGDLDAILDQMTTGVAIYDASGVLVRLNPAGERITRRHAIVSETQQNHLGRYTMRRTDGTVMPVKESPSGRALRGETVAEMECIIDGQHGPVTWLRCSATPLRDERGTIQGAIVNFDDITGQYALALEEARQRALAAAMIENTFSGMAVFDASDAFCCIQHNENFLHIMGPDYVARGSIVGASLDDLFTGETRAQIGAIFQGVRATGEPFLVDEFSASVPPSPQRRWFQLRLTPLRDGYGTIFGLLMVAFEITEMVEAREAERRRVKELQAVINAIPEGVMLTDNVGRFTLSNAAAARLLGRSIPQSLSTVVSTEAFATYAPDGRRMETGELPIVRALNGETVVAEELVYYRSDAEPVDLLTSAAPVEFDDRSEIAGAVAVFQDITRIKELERQRDDFLGIAAHELRTPLATILATLQAFLRRMQKSPSDAAISMESLSAGLERMHRQAQRLNTLVSDLLDTTRIRTGTLAYDMEPCDFVAVVRDAVAGQMAANPDRRVSLSVPKQAVMVTGDSFRLSQVVDNLVANALKYSAEPLPVRVSLRVVAGAALLRVSDKGVGIPPENIEHLFDRFYRVPGIDVQSGPRVGLGLGLHITRTVVERHGGRIEVRSSPGKGTAFLVTLPLQGSAARADTPDAEQA